MSLRALGTPDTSHGTGTGTTLAGVRRLTLIRHGLTDWNASGRFQGHSDVPLNELGRKQARSLARHVSGLEPDAEIHASPLSRAVETAQIAFPGRELKLDDRLRELDFGVFEGKTIEENGLSAEWAPWVADAYAKRAPGGESYGELRTRAAAWLADVIASDTEHAVAVTHSGTIQMLLAEVLGIEHPKWRKRLYLRHTSISRLMFRGDEVLIERVNDTRHLTREGSDPFLD